MLAIPQDRKQPHPVRLCVLMGMLALLLIVHMDRQADLRQAAAAQTTR